MKCKACGGTGVKVIYSGGYKGEGREGIECPQCNGTGEYEPFDADVKLDKLYPTEQTNEEWMKTLDTEELVDHLYEWRKDGSSVERQMWLDKHKERIKMQIRGWLKEKHNDLS